MPRVRRLLDQSGKVQGRMFLCPGCGRHHAPSVETPSPHNGAQWKFNGDEDRPTFTPSILVKVGPFDGGRFEICHSFVTDGRIQFLNDCTHDKRGQTIDLPEFPDRPPPT